MKKYCKKLAMFLFVLVMLFSTLTSFACKEEAGSEDFYKRFYSSFVNLNSLSFDISALNYNDSIKINKGEFYEGGICLDKEDLSFCLKTKIYSNLKEAPSEESVNILNDNTLYSYERGVRYNYSTDGYVPYEEYDMDQLKQDDSSTGAKLLNMLKDDNSYFRKIAKSFLKNREKKNADLFKKYFEVLFSAKETDKGYEVALDFQKVRQLNENLNSMYISDLIDYYFGENSFENLSKDILELLNKKAGVLLDEILNDLDTTRDELIMELINIDDEVDYRLLLRQYENKTIAEIIAGEEQESVEKIFSTINSLLGMCKGTTLYFMIQDISSMDKSIYDEISSFVSKFENSISLVYVLNDKVEIESLNCKVNVKENNITDDIEIKVFFNKKYEKINDEISKIKNNYKPIV